MREEKVGKDKEQNKQVEMKGGALLLIAVLITLSIFFSALADANDQTDCKCKSNYEGCLSSCGYNLTCISDCKKQKWEGGCESCDTTNWVVLECDEDKFFPGAYPASNCTISKNQTLYSKNRDGINYALYFMFDKFEIKEGVELRVLENTTEAGGGNGTGGEGGKGGKGGDFEPNGGPGGAGGAGAQLNSPAKNGEKGKPPKCSGCVPIFVEGGNGGNAGGRIYIISKYFVNKGSLSAEGQIGETGHGGWFKETTGREKDWNTGGAGGGGGGGGGSIVILSNSIDNQGRISAAGGMGGFGGQNCEYPVLQGDKGDCDSGADEAGSEENGGGGGGGGGGDGGTIVLISKSEITNKENLDVSGGLGGCWGWENDCEIKAKYEKKGGSVNCIEEFKDCEDKSLNVKFDSCLPYQPNYFQFLSIYVNITKNMQEKGFKCVAGGYGKGESADDGKPGTDGKNGTILIQTMENCTFVRLREIGNAGNVEVIEYPNGAAWCDYIHGYSFSDGNDSVGSSHWAFHCEKGEIKVDASDELLTRGSLCVFRDNTAEAKTNYYQWCLGQSQGDCESINVDGIPICKWNDSLGCIPKYPYGGAVCSLADNATIVEIDGCGPDFLGCIINKLDSTWKNNAIAKCTAIGDCGERKHFLDAEGVKVQPGYSFIAAPINSSHAIVKFRCESVVSEIDKTGDKCNLCNPGKVEKYFGFHRNCSQYNCESLGSNCVLENGQCVAKWDASPPQLSWDDTNIKVVGMEGMLDCYIEKPQASSTAAIKCKAVGECIPPSTPLQLNYKTNEPTICKIAFCPKEGCNIAWENMTSADNDGNFFKESHTWNIPPFMFPSSTFLNSTDRFDATAYLECRDKSNNSQSYKFNFCISNLELAPIVTSSIESNTYIPTKNIKMNIYVNKPVKKCDVVAQPSDITLEQSSFFVDKDGRWTQEINFIMPNTPLLLTITCTDYSDKQGSLSLTFYPEMGGLNINVESPPNNARFIDCKSSTTVTLKVTTTDSNGNPKNAYCKYSNKSASEELISFSSTGGPTHQTTLILPKGDYTYYINCSDLLGYTGSASISFSVDTDTEGPKIKRLYKESDNVVIQTNKKATCYSFDSATCLEDSEFKDMFIIGGELNKDLLQLLAKQLSTSDNIAHSIQSKIPLYIKCFDNCGNQGNCTTIYPY